MGRETNLLIEKGEMLQEKQSTYLHKELSRTFPMSVW